MKTTVKGIAAAAAVALTAFGAAAPALAETAPAARPAAVAAHDITSANAIAAAVEASRLGWGDVEGVEWHRDRARNEYVVTLTAATGEELSVRVDAATGAARAAERDVTSADAIAAAVGASGLAWRDVEGVEWHPNKARDYVVTIATTSGTERTVVVDAVTGVALLSA